MKVTLLDYIQTFIRPNLHYLTDTIFMHILYPAKTIMLHNITINSEKKLL